MAAEIVAGDAEGVGGGGGVGEGDPREVGAVLDDREPGQADRERAGAGGQEDGGGGQQRAARGGRGPWQ